MNLILGFLLYTLSAHASWHYNSNGGFGLYQPEGWIAQEQGRSSKLTSPSGKTSFFLASDWSSKVKTLEDLRKFVMAETKENPKATTLSNLPGFHTGSFSKGAYFLLRQEENFIVVEYQMASFGAETELGQEILGSIEVRKNFR